MCESRNLIQEIFLREVTVARAEPSFDCASVSGYVRRNLYRRIGIDSSPPIILVEFVRYIHSANQLFLVSNSIIVSNIISNSIIVSPRKRPHIWRCIVQPIVCIIHYLLLGLLLRSRIKSEYGEQGEGIHQVRRGVEFGFILIL